jgi:hypothetical protein
VEYPLYSHPTRGTHEPGHRATNLGGHCLKAASGAIDFKTSGLLEMGSGLRERAQQRGIGSCSRKLYQPSTDRPEEM